MKKNILVLVLGAVWLIPVIAGAGVKVYGQVQVEMARTSSKDSNIDIDLLDKGRGRIGIKALENLGNGVKGLVRIEFQVDTTGGDAGAECTVDNVEIEGSDPDDHTHTASGDCSISGVALAPREAMVGLKGSFGMIQLGRLKTPYKYTGGISYDPFVYTTMEARGRGGMSGASGADGSFGHNGFMSNTISYTSPRMGGFYIWGAVNPESKSGAPDDPVHKAAGGWNVSIKYQQRRFEVFFAANDDNQDAAYKAKKIGGRYQIGRHKVSVQLEVTNDAGGMEHGYLFVGYLAKFGKIIAIAQAGMRSDDGGGSYDMVYGALGGIYKFTKQMRVFGGLSITEVPDNKTDSTSTTVVSAGIRKDFR